MTSNTIVIPSKASLYAFGAEMASKVDGMNMRPLNKLFWSPRPRTFINSKFVYRRITEDTHICTYDFSNLSLLKGAGTLPKSIDFTAKTSGRMNCVIYWATIELWDKISLTSNPSSSVFKSIHPLYQSVSEMKMTPPPPSPPPQPARDPHSKQSPSQSPRQNSENTNTTTKDSKPINTDNSNKEGSTDYYVGDDIFSYRRFFVYRTKEGTIILSEGIRHIDGRREMPVLISFPVNPKPVIPPTLYSTLMSRARCCAYRKGLEAVLKAKVAGTTVLSLNSGAGIVPMLAATNGAECVVGTEEHTSLWKASQQVLRANEPSPGAFGTVNLINSESTQVMPGLTPGFEKRASVCVFEGFTSRLVGNGLISALEHAHKYLVSAGCCAVPAVVTVYGALVDMYRTEITCKGPKVNVSGLNEIMLGMNEDLDLPSSAFLTKPFSIFKFNFGMNPMCNIPKGGIVNIDARAITQGVASGVAMWFEIDMDGTSKVILTNGPQGFPSSARPYSLLEEIAENAGVYSLRSVWGQNVNWFNSPYQVAKGSKISLKAYYTNSNINVAVNKYSRDVTQMDVHPLVAGKGSSEICSKRAMLRVKLRKILTKRADKVPDVVNTALMGSRKVIKKGKKGSAKGKRKSGGNGGNEGNSKKSAKRKDTYEDDEDDEDEDDYEEDEEDDYEDEDDEDEEDSDSWEDEDDENEYYSDDDDDDDEEDGNGSDEDDDDDREEEEDEDENEEDGNDSDGGPGNNNNNGDEYLDGNKKSSGRVKEDLSYLEDEYDEEDYDEDEEDDIWNILGAITENAVELGIDPDIAADFILDLCRDF